MLVPGLQAWKVLHFVCVLTVCLMDAEFEQASLTSKMTAASHGRRISQISCCLRVGGIVRTQVKQWMEDEGRSSRVNNFLAGQHS
jgi:hypothetical protein